MRIHTLVLLAASLASSSVLAKEINAALFAPADGDMTPRTLSTTKAASFTEERAAVDFAWAIDPAAALHPTAAHVAESREFWTLLDAQQLKSGHRLRATAPGSLIRISPAEGSAKARTVADVEVRFDGRVLSDGNGLLRIADAEQLKALGVDFGRGTRVIQLDPALGAGTVELRAKAASGRMLVHMHEPNSDVTLALSAERDAYLAGNELVLAAQFADAAKAIDARRIAGVVTAPDGRSFDVEFARDKAGRYATRFALPQQASAQPGLWEVHAFGSTRVDGAEVLRDAKTSFALAQPTARLDGRYRATVGAGVTLDLGVEAAAAGRYELRGTLYGTNARGELVPFAVAHAARWLDAGRGDIALKVNADLVAQAAVAAPFELRDLSLNDQGRLGKLETRARAARIER